MITNNLLTTTENLSKIGTAVQLLIPCYIHEATKWDIVLQYHKWLVASAAVDFLYKNKPNNWIEDARKMSVQKYTAMRNVIERIDELYKGENSHTHLYYDLLNGLFGEGNWTESRNLKCL